MSSSAFRHVVLKDLHLLRPMSAGAIVGGLAAAALMTTSPLPINLGGLLLICTMVVLIIFQAMAVVQERKDHVSLFVFSMPLSPAQYVSAKALATLVSFAVPWLILTAAVAVAVDRSQIPDGYLPFWMALQAYHFFYFCALFAVALNTESTAWHATAVTVGNISVNVFIMVLFSLPSVKAYADGPSPIWSGDLIGIMVTAPVVGFAVLALGIAAFVRRTEYV